METSRGRWFLGEYTKRNRNADTAMVLDAVARIEQNIAAARTAPAEPEPPSPDPALAALEETRSAILAALADPVFDRALAPWRRSSRIIQEIAWALRESGADPRICDILSSQVQSIETACSEFPASSIREAVLGALHAAIRQISPEAAADGAGDASAIAPTVETAADSRDDIVQMDTDEAASAEMLLSSDETAVNAGDDSITPEMSVIEPAAFEMDEDTGATSAAAVQADADADPVLERLSGTPPDAETLLVSDAAPPEPVIVPIVPAILPEPSLGASLIAQGVVKRPLSNRPDPLAAIRRMSQAEKVAFFS